MTLPPDCKPYFAPNCGAGKTSPSNAKHAVIASTSWLPASLRRLTCRAVGRGGRRRVPAQAWGAAGSRRLRRRRLPHLLGWRRTCGCGRWRRRRDVRLHRRHDGAACGCGGRCDPWRRRFRCPQLRLRRRSRAVAAKVRQSSAWAGRGSRPAAGGARGIGAAGAGQRLTAGRRQAGSGAAGRADWAVAAAAGQRLTAGGWQAGSGAAGRRLGLAGAGQRPTARRWWWQAAGRPRMAGSLRRCGHRRDEGRLAARKIGLLRSPRLALQEPSGRDPGGDRGGDGDIGVILSPGGGSPCS